MHTHFPETTLQLTDRKSIVEVLGILGVDGTGEHITHILTTVDLLLGDGSIDLLCRLLHILRILVRQVILGKDGMHLGIVLTRLSEDIHHRTDDVLMFVVRPLYHLYHRLVVGLTTLQLTLGDDDVVDKSRILGHQEGHILLHPQTTYNLVTTALYDLDHHRLLDMLVTTSHIRHLHTVAVHRRHRVTFCHEHRRTAIIWQERVAAIRLTTEHTLLNLCLQVQTVGRVAHLREEVIPRHLLHRIDGEHLQRMGIKLQNFENLLERERLVRMMLEEILQQFGDLLLSQTFSTFLLSHRLIFLYD